MPRHARGCSGESVPRPALEIATVFRAHGEAYRREHPLSPEQRAVMRAIELCRTPALGGHLDVCTACGHQRPAYNSCRNRHCPKCQSLSQARWIERRMARILDTHYFHVVFTLPADLRPLALANRRRLFAILFAAASQTLLTLGRDPVRLGAVPGITAVLHTWTRDLQFHPHLHCIVTGGGLALDGRQWKPTSRRHLFPVKVLSALFRAKFLAALKQTYRKRRLDLRGACADLADPHAFARFADRLYRQSWVVYAKRPFGGAGQVFRYLGRYTHRVGLSNRRLRTIDPDAVRFATKAEQEVTLRPNEFIRRFLLHVLPTGFVKIRHFGLFASPKAGGVLERARTLLAAAAVSRASQRPALALPGNPENDWRGLLQRLTGIDLALCPLCGRSAMARRPLPAIVLAATERAPP